MSSLRGRFLRASVTILNGLAWLEEVTSHPTGFQQVGNFPAAWVHNGADKDRRFRGAQNSRQFHRAQGFIDVLTIGQTVAELVEDQADLIVTAIDQNRDTYSKEGVAILDIRIDEPPEVLRQNDAASARLVIDYMEDSC